MADHAGWAHVERHDHVGEPCPHLGHRLDRRALRPTVTGKVDCGDPVAMVGEVAGLQLEDGAVHAGAVHKHYTGQGRVVLAATVGVADRPVVEDDVHRSLPCLSLADLQCVAEIVDDVANVLDANRHTDQIFADPGGLEILG